MTQADNLASLGTNVNSSGVLQPASGGTGITVPGSNGNVLTSNGSAWVSTAPASSGLTKQQAVGLNLVFGR
jgi:hypothetical protein